MSDERLVTAETVAAAAEALTARGERPSVRAITRELGGGSPNQVLPLLRGWKSTRAGEAGEAPEEDAARPAAAAPATLDALPDVAHAIDGLTATILAAVVRVQATERRATDERLAALSAAHAGELAGRDRAHAEAIEAVRVDLEDTQAALDEALPFRARSEELERKLADAEATANALRAERTDLERQVAATTAALDEATKSRAAAENMATHAEAQAEAWRSQLAKVEAERDAARAETAAVRTKAEAAADAAQQVQRAVAEAGAKVEAQANQIAALAADVERLRSERDAANGKADALLERAVKAEAAAAKDAGPSRRKP